MTKNHIITGGPGIGKTTVINLLAELGFEIVPEVARIVIQEQESSGGPLPWIDPVGFQILVAEKQLELESAIDSSGHVFQDRSLIDGYGYCQHFDSEAPDIIAKVSRERYGIIFLLEPLPDYVQDGARKEDQEEALKIHLSVLAAYEYFGYTPVSVPVLQPRERVRFILDRI